MISRGGHRVNAKLSSFILSSAELSGGLTSLDRISFLFLFLLPGSPPQMFFFFFYRSNLFHRPGESTKLKVSRSTSISRSGCNLSHDVSFFFFFFFFKNTSRYFLPIYCYIRDTKFFFFERTFLSL